MQLKKIRLLHLIKTLDMGGIEKSTILYSNELVEHFEFIGIYASKGFYDNSSLISKKIKRVFPLYPVSQKKHFIKNLLDLLSILRKNKITHLHYHHRIFIPFIFFIKITYPRLEIIYTHHSTFNDIINNFIISDKMIALNEATRKDLPKRLWKKTIIIPHGVQLREISKEGLTSPKNIGYVGRFVKEKGLMNLIKAFKVINQEIPDTKLILVGDGLLKNELIEEINNLKITKDVIFRMPSISEDKIYSDIDILVLPSEKLEGFGLVILEAMAREIPVIVRNLSTFKEIVKDNYNGLIFIKDFDEIIISFIENTSLYERMKINCSETVKENYSIECAVEKYYSIYEINIDS